MAGGPKRGKEEHFMSHVEKQENGCWLWTAYKMKNGYGTFRAPHRHELAHRVSHELFVGPIPDGFLVMHSCDNPSCVAPHHLSVGTQHNNMHDAAVKGRMRHGEKHGRAKLSNKCADEIRNSVGTQKEIAAKYGIRQGTVSRIKTGARRASISSEVSP
jgi:hypothetical protein